MKLLKVLFLSGLCSSFVVAESTDLDSDDLDITLETVDLELEEMATPDLPESVLPDLFRYMSPTIQSVDTKPSTEAPEEDPNTETPGENSENVKINVIEVNESFFRLKLNEENGSYARFSTNEARPGDLIELVVNAQNKSDEVVKDVEMVNSIPEGPIQLLANSFKIDTERSLYRISRDGETFFPAEAELDPSEIRFVQWVIYSLQPGEEIQLSYRIKINN